MFGGDFARNVSPLQNLIARAVHPYKAEPDYTAHLDVAEYINNKKANTPREAAMTTARIVNNRNASISLHALALLDTLVQQCGYPFHLQVSTKEFLNELVRRFPERPPPFPGPVMSKILGLIHTWKETICVESRWREDLGNIRDMHRLLTFKGYRFREAQVVLSSVASSSVHNLKSAEELEEEDRTAQSAKLQELIRRGTPRDLAAAQEIMKSLAGAEPDRKPDYRSQSLAELNKLEQKVILLNEMLDNIDTTRGERFAGGDAYDQVSSILLAARPKIQKWISDAESGDPEMLDIFLQMNDQMNSVINRYEAFKRGDYAAAANPVPAELASSSRTQDTSLIDFEDPPVSVTGTLNAVNDLASVFSQLAAPAHTPHNVTASSAHPAQQVSTAHLQQPAPSNGSSSANVLAGLFDPPSPPPAQGNGQHFGSIMLPGTPQPKSPPASSSRPQPSSQSPGAFWTTMASNNNQTYPSAAPGRQAATPSSSQQTRLQPISQQAAPASTQRKDPFADLAGLF